MGTERLYHGRFLVCLRVAQRGREGENYRLSGGELRRPDIKNPKDERELKSTAGIAFCIAFHLRAFVNMKRVSNVCLGLLLSVIYSP